MAERRRNYHRERTVFLAAGALAGIISTIYTGYKLKDALDKPAKFDAGPAGDALAAAAASTGSKRKVVVHDEQGREIVPTGHSAVPSFPRTMELPASIASDGTGSGSAPAAADRLVVPSAAALGMATTEYTLVGLGLRTVSFLGIGVYLVGFYVATADVAALQAHLVKKVNPLATTLVAGERDVLRANLLDPEESVRVWDEALSVVPLRSAFRIVPVRDTDFHHMREGFVRAISARPPPTDGSSTSEDDFRKAVKDFREIFNRGKVPKSKEMLLCRDRTGRLIITYDDGKSSGRQDIGSVDDARISRALWLNYLGGKKPASEVARKSIVEGIMEFVERPVGTVAAQVV